MKEVQGISVRIYALVLSGVVFAFATLLYMVEGGANSSFQDIPTSAFWTMQVILGGSPDVSSLSTIAKFLVLAVQFTSLLLFGVLIHIVGHFIERRLLGSSVVQK